MYTISLPPEIRMNAENMMVCALWLGPCKPPMTLLLPPVLSKIDKLEKDGLGFTTQDGDKILKAKLVAGVFDFPAKAMALNIMQFDGYYGCPYCLDKGFHKHKGHLYYPDELHKIRKQKDIKRWAQQAELKSCPVYGIKGYSVLRAYLPIRRIPIDYMHAMLERITKAFLECWMNPKNKRLGFYLGQHADKIDKHLKRIKPPHEFRRSPRPTSKRYYWKASEFRAWLLYYSLPILSKFLTSDYIQHWALFVSAMHLLLGVNISATDINFAEELLSEFYMLVPELYPEEMLTANLHSVVHLCSLSDC